MRQTGNYYYGARYYNPKWSIWLSVDPLAEQTMDAYGYCYQNPINLIDPTGMNAEPPTKAGEYEGQQYYDVDTGVFYESDSDGNWHSDLGGENQLEGVDIIAKPKVKADNSEVQQSGKINKNQKIANIAKSYSGYQRIYSMSNKENTIDCSRFTLEVAKKSGYGNILPRVAYDQANWFKKNAYWSTKLSDAKAGDHIFWQRDKNAFHTGIVVDCSNGSITVIQAQVNGYKPGAIKKQKLMENGQMKGFNQPFVGIGRYKEDDE